jgi:hypothetical protein
MRPNDPISKGLQAVDAGLTMTTMELMRDDQAGLGAVAATELHGLLQRQLGD